MVLVVILGQHVHVGGDSQCGSGSLSRPSPEAPYATLQPRQHHRHWYSYEGNIEQDNNCY